MRSPDNPKKLRVLKMIRVIRDINQVTLARESGVSQATLSRIECGAKIPDRATAERIARVLGLTPTEIFPEMIPAEGGSNGSLSC